VTTWTIPRHKEWEARLQTVFARWQHAAYDRVTSNCLLMIHEAVLETIGSDRLEAIGTSRDEVTTPKGMLRLLAKHGGSAGIVDAALGDRIPLMQARKGDVAMCPGEDEEAFGVVDGYTIVCLADDGGLTHYPLAKAMAAWRVGE